MENLNLVDIAEIANSVGVVGALVWFIWAFMTGKIRSKRTDDEQMAIIGDVVEKAVKAGNADMKEAIEQLDRTIKFLGTNKGGGIF